MRKELETMKQLKPHPYVIKLPGCITESGMLWLWPFNFAIRIFLTINSVRLSIGDNFASGFWDNFFVVEPLLEYIRIQKKPLGIVDRTNFFFWVNKEESRK